MESRRADGLLLVDKPAGVTSHDVVSVARRTLGIRRIGHAGTLDPFATGLLVLLVGRATRLLPYLDAEPKVYDATIRFGAATTTDDLTGAVTTEAALPDDAAVATAVERLTGSIDQRPPAYSAKQVGGVRAHAAARRGEPLDLSPVRVTVHSWELLRRDGADLRVRVTCSGGTYVRALARDLGELSGSAAHLASLRRIRSGSLSVEAAVAIGDLQAGDVELRPMVDALSHLEVVELDEAQLERVTHGNPIVGNADSTGLAALVHAGEVVSVAVGDGSSWQPRVVLTAGG